MIDNLLIFSGRLLLGLYFVVPGILKVVGFDDMAAYMTQHGMFAVPIFLMLTITIQITGGICLFVGYRVRPVAFLLAGLVLVISLVMHDFWNVYEGGDQAREMQNFIKNMAIMAGLLMIAGATPTKPLARLFTTG
ncbi:MAG: DoxX family protein [Gammaproteobacteria bacterium]|nr:MAG: DoxX family protein [Gammaproteobacteria bacterium]TDJ37343.1 MAG: DoxX family protein [Gammaproteobacteria bacterium]